MKEVNINIRAAVVHVIGDMLQSIGVIIAAACISINEEFKIADPICTYLFSILVIMTTIPVFRDCMRILMEVQPNTVDSIHLRRDIERLDDVEYVEDLHVWALAGSKNVMTVHVRLREQTGENQIPAENRNRKVHFLIGEIVDKYDISHFTAQIL